MAKQNGDKRKVTELTNHELLKFVTEMTRHILARGTKEDRIFIEKVFGILYIRHTGKRYYKPLRNRPDRRRSIDKVQGHLPGGIRLPCPLGDTANNRRSMAAACRGRQPDCRKV